MTEPVGGEAQRQSSAERVSLRAWLIQGARSALLATPDWTSLRATPLFVGAVFVAEYAFGLLVLRLYVVGDAAFNWPSLVSGWLAPVVSAWVCWLLLPEASADGSTSRPANAMSLFAMINLQALAIGVALGLVFVPTFRYGPPYDSHALWIRWAFFVAPLAWVCVAQVRLVWSCSTSRVSDRLLASLLLVAAVGLNDWLFPQQAWVPVVPPDRAVADAPLALTQELMELQPRLLAARLDALQPQRPGVVDLYAITFAPYASQDVFMRESALVAGVMEQRFDAVGRTVELVNNKATAGQLPWATPLNLERAIAGIAQRMDRDEDVLFIHLTSHGAANGRLAAEFPPMTIASVTPQALKRWLDDAGIRYRVISVSACYSGSWIEPLAGDGTLVMTAADADHTSYGCGSRSPFTFFGKAMYDDELRVTRSFEQAHAAARKLIEQREREAGKEDGYSNPQIRVGAGIRKRLALLEARLAASSAK